MAFEVSEIVGIITAFSIVSFIIWNSSKKTANMEQRAKALDERQSKDIIRLDHKIEEVKLGLEAEIQRQTGERKDDILAKTIQEKDELSILQKQIDANKADVKGLLSKIEVTETKIGQSDNTHTQIRADIKDAREFYADWIQRVEDRIEDLRRYFYGCRNNDSA